MRSGTVLVTGATGFLGRPLLDRLLEEGRSVRILVREPSAADLEERPGLEIRKLDLGDPTGLPAAMSGVASVVHLAAQRRPGRPDAFHRVNVDGTTALARAAREAGVELFLHVSSAFCSASTVGPDLAALGNPYFGSRLAALDALRELEANGLPLTVASPSIVFGPDEPDHSNRITDEIRRLGRSPWSLFVDGGRAPRNLVHRDDVVEGLLSIEAQRPVGRDIVLAGESVTHRRFDDDVRALWENPRKATLSLPLSAARASARILDRLLPGPPWRHAAVRTLAGRWAFDDRPARELLGYDPRPFSTALEQTMDFLQAETS